MGAIEKWHVVKRLHAFCVKSCPFLVVTGVMISMDRPQGRLVFQSNSGHFIVTFITGEGSRVFKTLASIWPH